MTPAPLGFLGWMGLAGGLLLVIALIASRLRRLPVSGAVIYMCIGIGLGPQGLGWLRFDVTAAAQLAERVTECAVIISLFIGGLKLRLPFRDPAWRAAFRLAGPVMLLSIIGVAVSTHYIFGVQLGAAMLIGAVLAPTDPVLAGAVAVREARDADRVRYGLSGEAGLNDGMAFPFVVFGLLWLNHGALGGWVALWALRYLLWAIPVALLIGYGLGRILGMFALWLRARERDREAPNNFLVMALICLSYVVAEQFHTWGFLATFAAGLGLRHAEVRVVQQHPHPKFAQHAGEAPSSHPPAEHLVPEQKDVSALEKPAVSAGVLVAETLSFGQTLERILEFLLVTLVGVALFEHWDTRSLILAALLLFVLRPLAVWLALLGSPTSLPQRWLIGWFGIRGIGSLYYLCYAYTHGFAGEEARVAAAIVVPVIAMSIVLHGTSANPLVELYERRRGAGREPCSPTEEPQSQR
jgi:NhaP-type Na+/H+ or K+/H+ antiporter